MMAKEWRDNIEGERMVQLMTDRTLKAEYMGRVNKHLNDLLNNPKRFEKKIDMNIQRIFEKA